VRRDRLSTCRACISSSTRRVRLRALTPLTALALLGAGVPAASPAAADVPGPSTALPHTSIAAPASVTRGGPVALRGLLTVAGLGVPGRQLEFLSRPPGTSTWTTLGLATTDGAGWASFLVASLPAPDEFGVAYSLAGGLLRTPVAAAVVHVVDVHPAAPVSAAYRAPVHLGASLFLDRSGVAGKRVQFLFRPSAHSRWTAARWATTDAYGRASLTGRFTRSFQLGVRFAGAPGLAPSPLRITTVTVRPPAIPAFVFPFRTPGHARPPSTWTLDNGVDIFAYGEACGASALLVAVGNGTVIQTGISGFGPTAPVIRMSSGPFAGRNVYYGHTGHIYVHVGQVVRAGQVIAQIGCGDVGISSGPHLEIGVGVPGGPPCCPARGTTNHAMYGALVAALRS
jgi:murein DD-endopeptidase MepM/ murein hydrolase activator NlpD